MVLKAVVEGWKDMLGEMNEEDMKLKGKQVRGAE